VSTAQGTLQGPLGFAQVPRLVARAEALSADGVLDLSGVSHADSAGLALLLELSRRCKAKGRELSIRGAKPQIVQLAHFFGLDQILHFA
jgi:phospholipid transport system transporter-binding protein